MERIHQYLLQHIDNHYTHAAWGGTITAGIAAAVTYDDVIKCVILAAVGAITSFSISLILKKIFKQK
jgi:hypothetical protein